MYHNIRDAINTSLVSIMPKILLEYFDAKLPPFRQNKIDRNGAFDINWAEKKNLANGFDTFKKKNMRK